MSINWSYVDGHFNTANGNQHIPFHDENLKPAGEIICQPKMPEKTNSLLQALKATVNIPQLEETYTLTDSEKKVHAIVEPVSDSKKGQKQILYFKSDKSAKINLCPENSKLSYCDYSFEYENQTYFIKSYEYKHNSIQQIFLEEEVVAATMREPENEFIVNFKTKDKYASDSWLWLSVLHSVFTKANRVAPYPTV